MRLDQDDIDLEYKLELELYEIDRYNRIDL